MWTRARGIGRACLLRVRCLCVCACVCVCMWRMSGIGGIAHSCWRGVGRACVGSWGRARVWGGGGGVSHVRVRGGERALCIVGLSHEREERAIRCASRRGKMKRTIGGYKTFDFCNFNWQTRLSQ